VRQLKPRTIGTHQRVARHQLVEAGLWGEFKMKSPVFQFLMSVRCRLNTPLPPQTSFGGRVRDECKTHDEQQCQ